MKTYVIEVSIILAAPSEDDAFNEVARNLVRLERDEGLGYVINEVREEVERVSQRVDNA